MTQAAGPPPALSPELAAFCESGISIVVAAHGSEGWPVVGLALACRADPARQRLRLVLARTPNLALLDAVREGGTVAATFSQPGSHRSIQMKGGFARLEAVKAEDRSCAAQQAQAFRRIMVQGGYSDSFAAAYCAYRPEDLAALSFAPAAAFLQTPGPGAGAALQP